LKKFNLYTPVILVNLANDKTTPFSFIGCVENIPKHKKITVFYT